MQSELPVKEEFTATVRNQTCGSVTRFVVTRGRIDSPPLISKSTLQELDMLKIRKDSSFTETNDPRIQEEPPGIKTIKQEKDLKPEINKIADEYLPHKMF